MKNKGAIVARATVLLEQESGAPETAKFTGTELAMQTVGLSRDFYFDLNGRSNEEGSKLATLAMAYGLVANIHRCHQKGWRDSAEHLRSIIKILERGFVDVGKWEDSDHELKWNNDTVRQPSEIQKVHDLLHALVLRRLDLGLPSDVLRQAHVALDVLCWILKHDENKTFGSIVESLFSRAKERGVQVTENPFF